MPLLLHRGANSFLRPDPERLTCLVHNGRSSPIGMAIYRGNDEMMKLLLTDDPINSLDKAQEALSAISLLTTFQMFQNLVGTISSKLSISSSDVIEMMDEKRAAAYSMVLLNQHGLEYLHWMTANGISWNLCTTYFEGDHCYLTQLLIKDITDEDEDVLLPINQPSISFDAPLNVLESLLEAGISCGRGLLKLCAVSRCPQSAEKLKLLIMQQKSIENSYTSTELKAIFEEMLHFFREIKADVDGKSLMVYTSSLRLIKDYGADVRDAWLDYILMKQPLLDSKIVWEVIQHGNWPSAISLGPVAVEEIVKLGYDVNADTRDRLFPQFDTPLKIATFRGARDIVQLLLKMGADVNAQTRTLYTALQIAAEYGYFRITLDLLESGADINTPARSFYGRTALENAAEQGRLDIVYLLIRNNQDLGKLKTDCKRAARLAREEGHSVIADLLEDHARKLALELGVSYEDEVDAMCMCQIHRYHRCGCNQKLQKKIERGSEGSKELWFEERF